MVVHGDGDGDGDVSLVQRSSSIQYVLKITLSMSRSMPEHHIGQQNNHMIISQYLCYPAIIIKVCGTWVVKDSEESMQYQEDGLS